MQGLCTSRLEHADGSSLLEAARSKGGSERGIPRQLCTAKVPRVRGMPMMTRTSQQGPVTEALSKSMCRAVISRGGDHSDIWESSKGFQVSHSSFFLATPVLWLPHLAAWYLMISKGLSPKRDGKQQ